MKNYKSLIVTAVCTATALSAIPFSTEASDPILYGTMNIPYADFYAGELDGSKNTYSVDAVSSATTTKWSKNGSGELFEGTFNQGNDDGTGTILGVTYPVAISQTDLEALGDNNYGFIALQKTPAAYKTVTVTDGKPQFSAVSDNEPITSSEASIKLSTSTPWGDYLIDVENKPEIGAIYGAVIKTAEGNSYAMCHEANIWRGELAWSSGFKTSEPHGNTLDYKNFVSLMGSTITEVDFITLDGYVIIPTNTYVPIKFENEVTIADSNSGSGKTSVTITGIPEDYNRIYTIEGIDAEVINSSIIYKNAAPGAYTLTISDANGKYADISAGFTLITDAMPAVYSNNKLVKAENAKDSDFANFVKNISTVTVNGSAYNASGKGSVKIIGEDGSIDFTANKRGENVFDGTGAYSISIKSTGYTKSLEFEIKPDIPDDNKDDKNEYKLGDVNSDGDINALDASIVLTEYANIATGKAPSFNEAKRSAADVNSDNSIDALDASKILSYYAATATGSVPSWK